VFCRSCGKQIESDARFCRYCGTRQAEAGAGAVSSPGVTAPGRAQGQAAARPRGGLERRLRHLFPRHHLQDEFMHLATIVAFVMAVIGFIFGMIARLYTFGVTWLLFSIALLLFLMVRESTLSHVRVHPDSPGEGRLRPGRWPEPAAAEAAAEGATAQSSPPEATPPPAAAGEAAPSATSPRR
jgi:hypothetical protein